MTETLNTAFVTVEKDAKKLIVFSQAKDELLAMVAISKTITVANLENKEQLAIAKDMKLKLRRAEIGIEKEGKSYRDVFNSVNKFISSEEKDLKEITSPEIARLDEILEQAEHIALMKVREAQLPERKERLMKLGKEEPTEDAFLLNMDSVQFETFYNEQVAIKNEQFREESQRKQDEETAKVKAEQEAKNAELLAREAKINEGQRKLDEEARAQEREAKARADERARLQREEEARKAQEARAQAEAEQKAIAEKVKLESAKKYQKFLADNGYTKEADKDFKQENTGAEVVLWKKVAVFKI